MSVICWACNGNGIINYPKCEIEVCEKCGGNGIDCEKTREAAIRYLLKLPNVREVNTGGIETLRYQLT